MSHILKKNIMVDMRSRPVNLPEGDIKNSLVDLVEGSDIDYDRLRFLIGFSIEI
jgi:hypothetical protein